ncbi:MAG: pyridoxine 5'-phosphate synthase [Chlorobi bacterium]|nr:pyridoxine 5'-phosphate synthase [Chlorobiota bacterium]
MVNLSVNINKIALLRNARGGNFPDPIYFAKRIQEMGADGITVHPRPDERHIRYEDVRRLRPVVWTELNVEGNPIPRFMELVKEVKPDQVTLVPDEPDQITSDHGWDTIKYRDKLRNIIAELKAHGIRTSVFVDPVIEMVEGAALTGTDRIELYTEQYAREFAKGHPEAVEPYRRAAIRAHELGLGVNAGHDLNLDNIGHFVRSVPHLAEVSIGHALVVESIWYGLENVIRKYQSILKNEYAL